MTDDELTFLIVSSGARESYEEKERNNEITAGRRKVSDASYGEWRPPEQLDGNADQSEIMMM